MRDRFIQKWIKSIWHQFNNWNASIPIWNYLRRNIGKTQEEHIDKECMVHYLDYLLQCGYKSISLQFTSHELKKEVDSVLYDQLNSVNSLWVSERKLECHLTYEDIVLGNKMLRLPFRELYILFVRFLALSYNSIAVLEDSDLAKRIISDLSDIGKSVTAIPCKKLGKRRIHLNHEYEVLVSTDVRNRWADVSFNRRRVFHFPMIREMTSLESGTRIFDYETDIIKNLIPRWNNGGGRCPVD